MRKPIYKVVSVESRKGGVGKTTVALLMSEMICNPVIEQKEKSKVIFLDMDLCGTSIKYLQKTDAYNHVEFSKHNLVEMFEGYLIGHEIPGLDCDFTKKEILLISSSMEVKKGGRKAIYTPQVLFDELHIVWFMEFLKELFEKYAQYYKDDYNIVFVLDNPPGFTSLVPSVQDLLIELGPGIGKTLFVSSLDYQDLEAVLIAMDQLFTKYSMAYKAASLFHQVGKKDESIEPLGEENFDKKLFDKLLNGEMNEGNFYLTSNTFLEPGKNYLKSPEKYIDLIINRVPKVFSKSSNLKHNLDLEKIKSCIENFDRKFQKFDEYLWSKCIFYNENLSLLHILFSLKNKELNPNE